METQRNFINYIKSASKFIKYPSTFHRRACYFADIDCLGIRSCNVNVRSYVFCIYTCIPCIPTSSVTYSRLSLEYLYQRKFMRAAIFTVDTPHKFSVATTESKTPVVIVLWSLSTKMFTTKKLFHAQVNSSRCAQAKPMGDTSQRETRARKCVGDKTNTDANVPEIINKETNTCQSCPKRTPIRYLSNLD